MSINSATTNAIGIFDSGVGGLAVFRAIREMLPCENLIYVADTHFAPYGDKPAAYVVERSAAIADFIATFGVKAMVVACNTATTNAVAMLRERYELPVVGIEPGIKPAVERSQAKRVVVLATQRTIESDAVEGLCQRFGGNARIILQACPGLVEQVELGDLEGPLTHELLERYTQPLRDSDADVLVLGCTHYAFLEPQIRSIVGDGIVIIEPSRAVARQLGARLGAASLLSDKSTAGDQRFFTSAIEAISVAEGISRLLDTRTTVMPMDNPEKRSMP